MQGSPRGNAGCVWWEQHRWGLPHHHGVSNQTILLGKHGRVPTMQPARLGFESPMLTAKTADWWTTILDEKGVNKPKIRTEFLAPVTPVLSWQGHRATAWYRLVCKDGIGLAKYPKASDETGRGTEVKSWGMYVEGNKTATMFFFCRRDTVYLMVAAPKLPIGNATLLQVFFWIHVPDQLN